MTQQFTASEVRDAITWKYGDKLTRISAMLHAFADLLEAQERAVPVAWLRDSGTAIESEAACVTNTVRNLWLASNPKHIARYTIPLYTHPASPDAERLAEALQEILNYRGGAANALEDEYVVDRAHQALDVHPAQAQPPANTERLAELLRGLEIGPMAATLSPKKLFAIGAAIAAQAKEAQPPAARVPDIDTMVNRFLSWRLPQDFAPDAGISFKPMPDEYMPHCWPTGTNLFPAGQVKEMILHMLAAQENPNG